jgi:ubiquitin-protein ligase
MNKRILKELAGMYRQQQRQGYDNRIIISHDTSQCIKALIRAPDDSVYKHKFFRFDFEIPEDYPYNPPKMTFVNHDGVRIHPTLYEDGRCCATILNTWGNDAIEHWTSSMTIESVLLSFMSFFDNDPYAHEPGGRGDESYTAYVRYQSWITCFLRYFELEKDCLFKETMNRYLVENIQDIFKELEHFR